MDPVWTLLAAERAAKRGENGDLPSSIFARATRLDAANFTQVREEAVAKGLITGAEMDPVLERLAARDFAVFSPVMLTAWARRPHDLERVAACG